MSHEPGIHYEGVHCELTILRPGSGVALLVLAGSDVGEFADFPMRELTKDLTRFGSIDMFIDARAVRGASIDVSGAWALWMGRHRQQFKQICMLTGSRYVQVTAEFVRRFAGLADRMKLFTEELAFEERLRDAILTAQVA